MGWLRISNRCCKSKIENIVLGQHDVSERFRIPQKLYGRETEIAHLLAVFDRVAQGGKEVVLYTGAAGIGKSALIHEVHKPIVTKQGWFISGKFDQFTRNVPYSAIIQAFQTLTSYLLCESDAVLRQWQTRILEAVGNNGQVLIDVIPELELILGKQPPVAQVGPQEAQNRFQFVFQNFVRLFASPAHPLVLFIDDLQWADTASLTLLQNILTDPELQALLFLGAYRDAEVDAAHPLRAVFCAALRKEGLLFEEITVTALQAPQINALLADTLTCAPETSTELAALVAQKTAGNPFFVNEFLRYLYQAGLIRFEQGWTWDLEQIRTAGITANVVELLTAKLGQLPGETLQLVKTAACIGGQFAPLTLALVCDLPENEVFVRLTAAFNEGFLLKTGDSLSFVHDRVREAAYSLLDEATRTQQHYKIGQPLLASLNEAGRAERLFEIVGQLNQAHSLLTGEERLTLSSLNLQAGQRAKSSAAYDAAVRYIRAGMSLLPGDSWQTCYDLTFNLHKDCVEAEYLTGNFAEADTLYPVMHEHAASVLDKVTVSIIQVSQYGLQVRNTEAIRILKEELSLLGFAIPDDEAGMGELFQQEIGQVETRLARKNIAELVNAPEMQSPESLTIMSLLSISLDISYVSGQQTLFALSVAKMVHLSLESGISPMADFGFVGYGLLLINIFKDYQRAIEFGRLGIAINEKYANHINRNRVYHTFSVFLSHWKLPFRSTATYIKNGYEAGIESGDFTFAGYSMNDALVNKCMYGQLLSELSSEVQQHLAMLKRMKNTASLDLEFMCQFQPIHRLCGLSASSDLWECTEIEYLEKYKVGPAFIAHYYCPRVRTAYLLEERDGRLFLAQEAVKMMAYVPCQKLVPETYLYASLIWLSEYSTASEANKKKYLEQIEQFQVDMKLWAENCEANYRHKYLLVEAEKSRVLGQDVEAMRLYEQAIASAKQYEFINNEALANELAGKFYLARGIMKNAAVYLRDAHYCYQMWGAMAKVKQLEEKYPQFLGAAERAAERRIDQMHTTTTITTTMTTDTAAPTALDAATMIKASQALSQEVQVDRLLDHLIRLAIENAGATRGLLLEPTNGTFTVRAERIAGFQPALSASKDAGDPTFPLAVIQQAARTGRPVLLNNVAQDQTFRSDPYLQAQAPKALLGLPIVHQGKVTALLYLENALSAGAFTPERVELLNVLAAQAAISLENARYVANLAEQERLKKEMELAQRIQMALLPKKLDHPDFEIAATMLPAEEVGGDYYDVLTGADGSLWLSIGDVSGHGVTPGLIMMMAQSMHATLTTNPDASPNTVVTRLNALLYQNVRERLEDQSFMTFTTFKYCGQGRFEHAGAHLSPLIYRQATQTVERLTTSGVWLSFVPDISHATQNQEFTLDVGDLLVLYTDGLTEAHRAGGELLDIQRFAEIVTTHAQSVTADVPPLLTAVRDAILTDVLAWCDHQRGDDMTLMLVRRVR